jgi:CBS domain-containing protein
MKTDSVDQLRDIMVKKVITIDRAKNVQDAARAMARHEVGSLVIVSNGRHVGIVTESDLVRKVCTKDGVSSKIPLTDIFSSPIIFAEVDLPIEAAVQRMFNNKIRRLVILENGNLVGIVTVSDLAKYVRTKSIIDEMFD